MSMPHDISLILTLTGGLGAALVLGFVTQKLRLSPLVGYLLAGILVGPHSPGFVADAGLASQLAEIGIILLMFGVGLHFHLKDLLAVRGIALGGAAVQITLTTLSCMFLLQFWGFSLWAGAVFGMSVSVASTVVLTRVLADNHVLHTPTGHVALGWLVVEDLFTILLLVLLPVVLGAGEGNIWWILGKTLLKLGALTVFTLVAGQRLIPALLGYVARTGTRDLFTLAVIVLALGIAVGSALFFDASMAFGAFLAGMVVGQSDFSARATAEALPLRRGMEKAVDAAVKAIEEQAIQIEGRDQVARVAFISSGDDTVGNTIAEAVEAVGSTGGISCADGSSFGVEVEIVEGIRYDRGFVVPAMITDEEHHFGELENPLVLVTDHEIKDVRPIIPMLERVVQSKRDLFIISNDLRGEALHTIMLNTTRGTFRTIATEMPDYVEEHNKNLLADIALACGATPYFKDTYPTLDDLTFDFLGGCDRVRVTKDTTVITGGHGDPEEIEKRANYLRSEIARIVNPVFIEKLEDRLQKLLGKVAIIRIGAASEAELKEMKSRM